MPDATDAVDAIATVSFSFPNTIHLGPGVCARLADELRRAGAARPLVVTDRGVAALGFFGLIVDALRTADGLEAAVFSEVEGNPREATVVAGHAAFSAHGADSVVAVGGGAALDVGKAIAFLARNPGSILEYADDLAAPRAPSPDPLPFILAIPTTAGTGSEVGRSSVVSEDETGRKRVIFQPPMLPRVVLADPELLVGLPPHLSAATGMDALTHNLEAFLATGYHPMCDGIALEGLRLVKEGLARSVSHPEDLSARRAMLMASTMGAVAFQKGLGATHACAHALSAVLGTHHGLANAVLLDACLQHAQEDPQTAARMARCARVLEIEDQTADGLRGWIAALRQEIGLPASPAAVGVREEHLDRLVDLAARDACLDTAPRRPTRQELRGLLGTGLGGTRSGPA